MENIFVKLFLDILLTEPNAICYYRVPIKNFEKSVLILKF